MTMTFISSPSTSEMRPSAAVCGPPASLLHARGLWKTIRDYSWHGQIWKMFSAWNCRECQVYYRGRAVSWEHWAGPFCLSCRPSPSPLSLSGWCTGQSPRTPLPSSRTLPTVAEHRCEQLQMKNKETNVVFMYTQFFKKKLMKGLRPNQMLATCF